MKIQRLSDRLAFGTRMSIPSVMVVLAVALPSTDRGGPAVVTASAMGPAAVAVGATKNGAAIRPFRVNVPVADLDELRRRIAATRWPEKETVADSSQGVPLCTTRELARYWATDCDWRPASPAS